MDLEKMDEDLRKALKDPHNLGPLAIFVCLSGSEEISMIGDFPVSSIERLSDDPLVGHIGLLTQEAIDEFNSKIGSRDKGRHDER